MSARSLRGRLDRLAGHIAGSKAEPECRFHGTHCRMGANWPLPYPTQPDDDLLDWLAELAQGCGDEPRPHPRDVWKTDWHDLVTQAEIEQRKRDGEELLAWAKAKNDQIEAQLRAERDAGLLSEGD